MIAPLRRRHRSLIATVGAITLLGLIAAWTGRLPAPVEPERDATERADWTVLDDRGRIRALRERLPGQEWLAVERRRGYPEPDVLLYWSPEPPRDDALPEGSVLIAPLGDPGVARHPLPVSEAPGHLVLYSLGHERVVASEPFTSIRLLEAERGR